MATLCINNFPDELYVRVKQSAARHGRSISAEVIWLLEQALRMEEERLRDGRLQRSKNQE